MLTQNSLTNVSENSINLTFLRISDDVAPGGSLITGPQRARRFLPFGMERAGPVDDANFE